MNFGYDFVFVLEFPCWCVAISSLQWLQRRFRLYCRMGCVSSPSSELRTSLLCLSSSANGMQYCFFKSRVHKHWWQMFLPLPLATNSSWNSSWTSLVAQMVKRLPPMWETWVQSLGREDLLEKEMAIHSSILAWKIQWTEQPGRLQSMGLQRVRHDWTTSLSFFLSFLPPRREEISDCLPIWYSNTLGTIIHSQGHHGIFWKKQWYSTIW